ncbi:MAG: hypothetical protein ACYTGH_05440, partial [Planctomycetota bacterium]
QSDQGLSILLSTFYRDYGQIIEDDERQPSTLFSHRFTQALSRHRQSISARTLYQRVRDAMSSWSRRHGPLQSPALLPGEGSRFRFPKAREEGGP